MRVHFGVYGIIMREDKILVVNKEKGHYKNRYDLPGGSMKETDKDLIDTLKRELYEEAGIIEFQIFNNSVYDFWINPINEEGYLHIAIFYNIHAKIDDQFKPKLTDSTGEENDSSEAHWFPVTDLTLNNASPLLLKAKEIAVNRLIKCNFFSF